MKLFSILKISLFFGLVLTPISLLAQVVMDFDTSFNSNGIVQVPFENASRINPLYVEVLADDSYIVAVNTHKPGERSTCFLTKYLSDGSLDTSFGNFGLLLFETLNEEGENIPGLNFFTSLEKIATNQFIVFGVFNNEYQFFKIDANGTIIEEMGDQGFVNFEGDLPYVKHLVMSDGSILIAQAIRDSINKIKYGFKKYFSNGLLDDTFGQNGLLLQNVTELNHDRVDRIASYPNNTFLCLGNSYPYYSWNTGVISKFNEDGSFVEEFGTDGRVIFDFEQLGPYTTLRDFKVLENGKILICGSTGFPNGTGGEMYYSSVPIIIRLNSDGSLDQSFNESGIVLEYNTLFGGNDTFTKIETLSNGKIVALGYGSYPFPFMKTALFIRSYKANGLTDSNSGEEDFFYYLYSENPNEKEGNIGHNFKILNHNKILVLGTFSNFEKPHEGRIYRLQIGNLGVDSFAREETKLYPNPTTQFLHIESPQNITQLVVFDMNGKILWKQQNNSSRPVIDVNFLNEGVYILQLKDEFQKVQRFKFIKY